MKSEKEAAARIKINNLLKDSGWRFFDDEKGKANIQLEGKVTITQRALDDMGEDFEQTSNGFVDYLLLDERGFPLCVLEAKKSSIHPLSAKEQARKYATQNNVQFIILSNGETHYFWDLNGGNPEQRTTFPTQESLMHRLNYKPNTQDLVSALVDKDFLAPQKYLRSYQGEAIQSIQKAAAQGKTRYLLEMATGTGKTTVAAAVCKLFLKTGNARRILFLVDRIELEKQAVKAFKEIFANLYHINTIKSNEWQKCEIVVTTVQTLMANNRYRELFSPMDFELVVSDEAHRGLSGNSRAVFEYFVGFKLGLTATPKDYLKGIDRVGLLENNPKALELRNLRDTYTTFGCENQTPTFRYDLIRGVNDNYLISPYAIDARTEVTTQLLSDQGLVITEDEESTEQTYKLRDFERKFFNQHTNEMFCRALLEKGLRDPFTGEFGKTLVFAVSQDHAAKLTDLLCRLANEYFPGQYSDSSFAVQVTSNVQDSQKFTEDFTENMLSGRSRFGQGKFPDYVTSKSRICITVGMMTTGYDCPDLLNVALMRPVYSPSDFIQMKGRGTRKHEFKYAETGETRPKDKFLLLDFFANCEYFEEKFDYKEKLKLNAPATQNTDYKDPRIKNLVNEPRPSYEAHIQDKIDRYIEIMIWDKGMKIDRELYPEINQQFELVIRTHESLQKARETEDVDTIIDILKTEIFEKPNEYWNAAKIRQSYVKQNPKIKRKITLREMVLKGLGIIKDFKSRQDRIQEEYDKFVDIYKLDVQPPYRQMLLRNFFETYLSDKEFREIIQNKDFALLYTNPIMTMDQLREIMEYKDKASDYIQEYLQPEMHEFDWTA